MELKGHNVLEAWQKSLKHIIDHGKEQESHSRKLKEVLNLVVTIQHTEKDILKPIEYLNSLNLWIYPPVEELASVILTKKRIPTIKYTYGSRIFNFHNAINQIQDFIIPKLRSSPRTRKAVVMLYDPVNDSKITLEDTPSLLYLYFRIIDKKLHVTASVRSNDFFIGWPTNAYQVHKLQELVAKELGISTGTLATISNSAHVFLEHMDAIVPLLQGGE